MSQPERIGRYHLFDAFAHGGMASVHFGRVDGALGPADVVAIKRHHPHLSRSPELAAMIRDEARITSRVQHRNVVRVLNVVAQRGELLLVMDYVAGLSLAELLAKAHARGERVPIEVSAALLICVLEGLHAAHQARDDRDQPLGIVHCNVSPQNILVGADGSGHITDFGIAHATERPERGQSDEFKGKIEYMAREQIRRESVDARTDVYAASVVLWEALAGRRLFEADDAGAVFARVVAGHVVPPSEHNPEVPERLDQLVLEGLAPHREHRPSSAREMALRIADAVTPATEYETAGWVRHIAGEEMATRARRARAVAAWQDPDAQPAMEVPTLRYRTSAYPSIAPTSVDVPPPVPEPAPVPAGSASFLTQALSIPIGRVELSAVLTTALVLHVLVFGILLSAHPIGTASPGTGSTDLASLSPRPAPTPFQFDLDEARPAIRSSHAAAPARAPIRADTNARTPPEDPALSHARALLRSKALAGAATPAEKRALRGICQRLHDASCSR